MAGVKYEERYQFPNGKMWMLMDEHWGLALVAEEEDDGNLIDMGEWEFQTREAWQDWGDIVHERMQQLESEGLSDAELINAVYAIDDLMPADIKAQQT